MTKEKRLELSEVQGQTIELSLASGDISIEMKGEDKKVPTFTMNAYTGKEVRQWWDSRPIVIDIEGINVPQRAIPVRMNHSSAEGVGHTTSVDKLAENGKARLEASGLVSRDTPAARDVANSAGKGFPWQASISASIQRAEEIEEGEVEVNGRTFSAPLLVVRASTLREISFVDLGADDDTSARVAASQAQGDKPEGSEAMAKSKPNATDVNATGDQNTNTTNTPAPVKASGSIGDSLEAVRQKASLNAERESKILAAAEEVALARPDMADEIIDAAHKAVEAGTDAGAFELEMVRTRRDFGGSFGNRRSDSAPNNAALEAALCSAGGMSTAELEESYDEQTLDAADKRYRGRVGLAELIMICAQQNGFSGPSVKFDLAGALRASMMPGNSGGLELGSTLSLPNILSNVANKFIMRGFNHVEDTWRKVTKIGTATDFKQKSTNALTGDYDFKQLPPSGKIEHAKPGEVQYTNQVDTFARMLTIDRRHIINDDLSALTDAPMKLGRGAALALNNDFWTKFQADSTIFPTDDSNSNYISGASSALSITAVKDLLVKILNQTDPDGKSLGLKPSDLILLTSYSNMTTAKTILNSTEVRNPAASADFGTHNPYAGMFGEAYTSYLTSTTAWYLIVKPEILPLIATDFLNGKESPTVDSAQADMDELGIVLRGFHDWGTNYQEYRAGAKSKGAA